MYTWETASEIKSNVTCSVGRRTTTSFSVTLFDECDTGVENTVLNRSK